MSNFKNENLKDLTDGITTMYFFINRLSNKSDYQETYNIIQNIF